MCDCQTHSGLQLPSFNVVCCIQYNLVHVMLDAGASFKYALVWQIHWRVVVVPQVVVVEDNKIHGNVIVVIAIRIIVVGCDVAKEDLNGANKMTGYIAMVWSGQ